MNPRISLAARCCFILVVGLALSSMVSRALAAATTNSPNPHFSRFFAWARVVPLATVLPHGRGVGSRPPVERLGAPFMSSVEECGLEAKPLFQSLPQRRKNRSRRQTVLLPRTEPAAVVKRERSSPNYMKAALPQPGFHNAAKPGCEIQANVILILADDLGWTDLSCYGSEFYQTPNIDRLAREGMKFTQAYSACTVCSPTRAAILTGKYPARLHITDWIPGLPPENPKLLVPSWTKYLSQKETTVARALQSAGYATASIGKWHLGGEEYFPEKHGFDLNVAGSAAAAPPSYFAPYKIATLREGPDGEYLTDRQAKEAVRFIEERKDKPFFLYLPLFAVHTPIQGKQALQRKYRAQRRPGQKQTNALYAAMIESMDDAVGEIRQRLAQLNLTERTVIIFTSDNGGRVPTTSNHPLRVGKGSCYEGGTRVPLIVHWPGVTKPGSISETPVISMDLFPTILEMTGQSAPTQFDRDGISLAPLLRGDGAWSREALFWHYPHYQHYQLGGTTPYGAVRLGDFKMIEFFDDMRVELYNLRNDPGEQHNLAGDQSEKVAELRSRLHAWRQEVGAQMPAPNPNYDPLKPEHDPATRVRKPPGGNSPDQSTRKR